MAPELADLPLSDTDRTGHLPKLYFDLICRLRNAKEADRAAASVTPATHGKKYGIHRVTHP